MDPALKAFLLKRSTYPDAIQDIQHIETHISDVFLTGNHAYKVKKAVRFDFLDFSTLEKRRHFCEREVTLNRRFAPELYKAVIPIHMHGESYSFAGKGTVVEYAIQMKQFDQSTLFSELLKQGRLTGELLNTLTLKIAQFHKVAHQTPTYWGLAQVHHAIAENCKVLTAHTPNVLSPASVSDLERKFDLAFQQRETLIVERQQVSVKALHGDLHLRNVCLYNGQPQLFDGIEFNDELACCDVWADIAFLIMDLEYRGRADFATLVTNQYLEQTDDFEGLPLLNLYHAYRATVRAKVSLCELDTINSDQAHGLHACESARAHLELALKKLTQGASSIIAIGGLSGSGKSTLARALATAIGAIHIRSDVVRKHMLGLPLLEPAPQSAYHASMDDKVYLGMQARAAKAVQNTGPVILDAVHGSAARQSSVEAFAHENKIPFIGIWCTVDRETAIERVRMRERDASDADVAIVEKQYASLPSSTAWDTLETIGTVSNLLNELFRRYPELRRNEAT